MDNFKNGDGVEPTSQDNQNMPVEMVVPTGEADDDFQVELTPEEWAEVYRDMDAFHAKENDSVPDLQRKLDLLTGAKKKVSDRRVPDVVVEHMLYSNTINELVAGPGTGKSTVVARLAACIADTQIGHFLGAFRVVPGRVVVYSEDPEGFRAMLRAIELAEDVQLQDRVYVTANFPNLMAFVKTKEGIRPGEALTNHINTLYDWAAGDPIKLVVFDTKAALMTHCIRSNGSSLEENSNDDQQAISVNSLLFCKSIGAAGLFLSHPTKASLSGDGKMDSRGGGAAKGAMWKTWSLRREKDGDGVMLTPDKQRGGGFNATLRLCGRPTLSVPKAEEKALLDEYESQFTIKLEDMPTEIPGVNKSPFMTYILDNSAEVVGQKEEKQETPEERRTRHRWTDNQKEVYRVFCAELKGRESVSAARRMVTEITGMPRGSVISALAALVKAHHIVERTEGRGENAVQMYIDYKIMANNPLLDE